MRNAIPRVSTWQRRLSLFTVVALTATLSIAASPPGEFGPPTREAVDTAKWGPGNADEPRGRHPRSYPTQPSDTVPMPEVEGPIDGGIRTGEPYATSMVELTDGYVEEEFFIAGTARGHGTSDGGEADYKTRILVRRPTDPKDFNGTVVLDWTNVTVPDDTDAGWIPMHPTIMERGFVYVSVAAQRLGVEVSPLALKQWDPVRYGDLAHPGDDYSWDIFSQASEAMLDPIVLGDLRPTIERRIASGASQSAGRLRTYINEIHEQTGVFDGFKPQISSPDVRTDVAPVLWVNSQSEIGDEHEQPDDGMFRLWELAGPAHTTNEYNAYQNAVYLYSHSNGMSGNTYDSDEAAAWGYQFDPGTCSERNNFLTGHTWSAALVALDQWLRTGRAPDPMPRAIRNDDGRVYDEHNNVAGGVRSPLNDVPIATYLGGGMPPSPTPCEAAGGARSLSGTTEVFDADKLSELYADGDAYLGEFRAATRHALERGWLLEEGAADLIRRAEDASAFVDEAISQ